MLMISAKSIRHHARRRWLRRWGSTPAWPWTSSGLPWDFSTQAKRDKALQKIRTDKRFVLIASPMCSPF